MRSTINVGRVLGIPLGVSYSWFVILGLVTFILAHRFGGNHPDWSSAEAWLVGGATSLLFFVSVLIHELSHSVLAVKKGIPVKGITLFIFGGISQIAREAHRPFIEFIIAAVGPLSSLILGGLFMGLYFAIRDMSDHLGAMSLTLALINFSLGVFNLLPGFPLDGGRVLRSVIWGSTGNYWRATTLATRGGQFLALVMIGGGLALLFFGELQGLWIAAVGWFLIMAASTNLKQFQLRQALQGYSVQELMSDRYPTVPAGTTLETLATVYVPLVRHLFYAVTKGERFLGTITLGAITRVPSDRWSTTTVESAMQPVNEAPSVGPNADGAQALDLIEERSSPWVLVLDGERLLGFVIQEDALRAERTGRPGRRDAGQWAPQP